MKKFKDFFKATFVGIAHIVPGISGGILAVVLNLYGRIIQGVDLTMKKPIMGIKSLWDIILGMVLGLLLGFFVLSYTYELWPLAITLLFIGLLIGSINPIINKIKVSFKVSYLIVAVISFAAIIAMPLLPHRQSIDDGVIYFVLLFIAGIISAFVGFAPGISGSLMLMVLGYYSHILAIGKSVFESIRTLEFSNIWGDLLPLFIMVVGIVIGFIISVKTVKKMINKYEIPFYYSVFGMVVASPISIMMLIHKTHTLSTFDKGQWGFGLLLGVVGFIISFGVVKYSENKENKGRTGESVILAPDSETN